MNIKNIYEKTKEFAKSKGLAAMVMVPLTLASIDGLARNPAKDHYEALYGKTVMTDTNVEIKEKEKKVEKKKVEKKKDKKSSYNKNMIVLPNGELFLHNKKGKIKNIATYWTIDASITSNGNYDGLRNVDYSASGNLGSSNKPEGELIDSDISSKLKVSRVYNFDKNDLIVFARGKYAHSSGSRDSFSIEDATEGTVVVDLMKYSDINKVDRELSIGVDYIIVPSKDWMVVLHGESKIFGDSVIDISGRVEVGSGKDLKTRIEKTSGTLSEGNYCANVGAGVVYAIDDNKRIIGLINTSINKESGKIPSSELTEDKKDVTDYSATSLAGKAGLAYAQDINKNWSFLLNADYGRESTNYENKISESNVEKAKNTRDTANANASVLYHFTEGKNRTGTNIIVTGGSNSYKDSSNKSRSAGKQYWNHNIKAKLGFQKRF